MLIPLYDARRRNAFLVLEDLAHRGLPVTADALDDTVPDYFGYREPDPRGLVEDLRRRGVLRQSLGRRNESGNGLVITRRGRRYLEEAVEAYFTETGMAAGADSAAFRRLCFDRQGLDLCQHGSLTARQLEAAVAVAAQSGPAGVLDLGCGVGEAGRSIAAACGASYVGVDASETAVAAARRTAAASGFSGSRSAAGYEVPSSRSAARGDGAARFQVGDLESYLQGRPAGSVDLVLAIDATYWIEDADDFVASVARVLADGGRFVCLSGEFDESRSGAATLPWEATELGAALSEVVDATPELRGEALDFTDEERELWLQTPALCARRFPEFAAEGTGYLLRNVIREAEYLSRAMERGRGGRYLYVLTRGAVPPISRR